MAGDWVGDELRFHTVVTNGVVEDERFRDRYPLVARVAEHQGGCLDARGVGDRSLFAVGLEELRVGEG